MSQASSMPSAAVGATPPLHELSLEAQRELSGYVEKVFQKGALNREQVVAEVQGLLMRAQHAYGHAG